MTFVDVFAKRVDYFLNKKSISKYKIENNTGMYHATLNSILNSKYETINSKNMLLIIKALGVSLAEFFDDKIFDFDNFDVE